jgi:hypothetical protein
MEITQGDFVLEVAGLGTWTLPALSALPSVHPVPGQPGRSIFVGESFETALVTPLLILSSGTNNYLVSETSATKLPSLTFPQKIIAADGTIYAASSPENVIVVSAARAVSSQDVEPTVVVDAEDFDIDSALATLDNVGSASTSHISGSDATFDFSGIALNSTSISGIQTPSHTATTISTSAPGTILAKLIESTFFHYFHCLKSRALRCRLLAVGLDRDRFFAQMSVFGRDWFRD